MLAKRYLVSYNNSEKHEQFASLKDAKEFAKEVHGSVYDTLEYMVILNYSNTKKQG